MGSVFNMRLRLQETIFQHPTLNIVEKILVICNQHTDDCVMICCCIVIKVFVDSFMTYESLPPSVQWTMLMVFDFSPHHRAVVKSAWQWHPNAPSQVSVSTKWGADHHGNAVHRSTWPIPCSPSEEWRAQGRFLCQAPVIGGWRDSGRDKLSRQLLCLLQPLINVFYQFL